MEFQNAGIKIYDVSFYQTIMFDYIDGKRVLLSEDKQKYINFEQMKNKSKAVIIKCGQRNYKDPAFDISWKNAKEAEILRGSYWFCDRFDNGKNQAKLYWSFLKNDIGEGILSADFETGSWTDLNELYVFINELQQLSGLPNHKIFVYTNYYYFMEARQNANRDWFSKFPLWIASYTNDYKNVRIPPIWEKCRIWQYGTPIEGYEAGVHSREIDGNWFNGDMTDFKKYFEIGNEIPTEEPNPVKSEIHVSGQYGNKTIIYKEI